MLSWRAVLPGFAACVLLFTAPAQAVEVQPHRALYSMTLGKVKPSSGVVSASGSMAYEWGESCDGWTVEQRLSLNMVYEEQGAVEITLNSANYESKDGKRFRFIQRRLRNGELDGEVRGQARLNPDRTGVASFVKPEAKDIALPKGVLFPTAHTLLLIDKAAAGESFVDRRVFDGVTFAGATQVTAVLGKALKPDAGQSPLLQRRSWWTNLAFFPEDSTDDVPDSQLAMRLFDNGHLDRHAAGPRRLRDQSDS